MIVPALPLNLLKRLCQNVLVPALDAGPQKNRLINQIFIRSVFMRSCVKRGNKAGKSSFTDSNTGRFEPILGTDYTDFTV